MIRSFGNDGYHFVDFDMPDEEDSQRYIHVQQSFIECDENNDLTKQRLEHMRDTFPECDLSAGKCLILTLDELASCLFYTFEEAFLKSTLFPIL